MNFNDIVDANGTSVRSYADLLIEKGKEAGFVTIIVLASKERKMLHTLSNADGSLPHLLIRLGNDMLKNQAAEPLESDIVAPKSN